MRIESKSDKIGELVLEKIRTHAAGDPNEVTMETKLTDLGIHSLELTEIIFDIEDEFGIQVEMNTVEAWENLHTIRDIVEAVRGLIDAKS
ncbi:acyl carrier protein NodF [Mesorhizobium sp. J18]|uniref:acyl carrier protein n=1 Tax=Mesorhizobium sp. J18 TaxID=935263 RepID=UPI00119B1EB2|nr:acyl carrier protein [Mesorhizobium sp. J18]TWG92480.1 acyl carrier protein NodF [Mesorhizobium sp. J18]